MKRINPATQQPYRCGDVDPNSGMVFRCYNLQRVRKDGTYMECWLMPAAFEAIKVRMRDRARARRHKAAFTRTHTTRQLIDALETAPVLGSSGGLHTAPL
jgi:hypothetical protein